MRDGPPTHEVLRLHVDDPLASVTRPVARLADLASVRVRPGGPTRVRLAAGADALDLIGRDLERRIEPGAFVLTVVGTGWSERLEVEAA
jgi:beta-xylosidase